MSCEAGPSSGRGWGLSSTTYLHSLTPSPVLSKYILSEGMKECKACNSGIRGRDQHSVFVIVVVSTASGQGKLISNPSCINNKSVTLDT